jgi:hypothetical protein
MLSYASGRGHAFIDWALYLPRVWTEDPQRCAAAEVPAERGFATKLQLVIDMLDRRWPRGCHSAISPLTPATAATPGCARGATPPGFNRISHPWLILIRPREAPSESTATISF